MNDKAFRVDWYARDSFMDFAQLKADEIGVLMQIINLIYSHNGPIDNDPKFIGKICGIRAAKCKTIVSALILKDHIFITPEGKIFKRRCERALLAIEERREKSSKSGKKGAEIKWGIQEKQYDDNSGAIKEGMASTSTYKSTNKNTSTLPYDIDRYLTDKARQEAREAAPGWDQQHLMRVYNEWINDGREIPSNPNKAYPSWCRSYTGGKPP